MAATRTLAVDNDLFWELDTLKQRLRRDTGRPQASMADLLRELIKRADMKEGDDEHTPDRSGA